MPNIMIELEGHTESFRRGVYAALNWMDGTDFTIQVKESPPDRKWVLLESSENDEEGDRTYDTDYLGQIAFKETGVVI